MNEVETLDETIKGWKVTVYYDQDTQHCDPRDWDNLSVLVCSHRRYKLGDKQFDADEYAGWQAVVEAYDADYGPFVILRPIYMHDHSGLSFQLGDETTPPSDWGRTGWDSGVVGFAYVSEAKMHEEYGMFWGPADRVKADACLKQEVETWGQWVNGEVYGYVVRDPEGKEHDSCWGYIGWEHARESALAALASCVSAFDAEEAKVQALLNQFAL